MHFQHRHMDAKLAQSWCWRFRAVPARLDAFLGEIPIFLFSLVGGVVADRVDRRHVLLASQYLQMSCALLLALLFAMGWVQVWHILCLSFVVGVAQAFGGPAYSALVPTLVGQNDLPNAIALNSIQFNLARIIGPVLGGLALTNLGAAWCFFMNGISFLAVIATLMMIRSRYLPKGGEGTVLESMKQGFVFIRGQGAMVSLIALAFLMTLLGVPLIVFLPVFAREVFRVGPEHLYLLLVCFGRRLDCGCLAGGYLPSSPQERAGHSRDDCPVGPLLRGFALSKWLLLSCLLLFLGSIALISIFALISSLVQLITGDEMRGRVRAFTMLPSGWDAVWEPDHRYAHQGFHRANCGRGEWSLAIVSGPVLSARPQKGIVALAIFALIASRHRSARPWNARWIRRIGPLWKRSLPRQAPLRRSASRTKPSIGRLWRSPLCRNWGKSSETRSSVGPLPKTGSLPPSAPSR
jgi:predicted MFS family arabinose efflux permease